MAGQSVVPKSRRFRTRAGGTASLPLGRPDPAQFDHRLVHDRDDGNRDGREPARVANARCHRPDHPDDGRGFDRLHQLHAELVGLADRPGGQGNYGGHGISHGEERRRQARTSRAGVGHLLRRTARPCAAERSALYLAATKS